jgi:hypothetical protein
MTAAINQLMAIAHPKKMQRDQENVMEQAVRAAVPKLGLQPDEGIGPEHVPELVRLIVAEITPFIISQNNAQLKLQRRVFAHLVHKMAHRILKAPPDPFLFTLLGSLKIELPHLFILITRMTWPSAVLVYTEHTSIFETYEVPAENLTLQRFGNRNQSSSSFVQWISTCFSG